MQWHTTGADIRLQASNESIIGREVGDCTPRAKSDIYDCLVVVADVVITVFNRMLIVVDYDPWMVGSLLLSLLLFMALLALLAALLYILCYKRKNTIIVEEVPTVTPPTLFTYLHKFPYIITMPRTSERTENWVK